MRYDSHLNTAIQFLRDYEGSEPFASFIKKKFKQSKKFGSNDRKSIGNLCYCYFRLGHSLNKISIEERILVSLFLCQNESNEMLGHFKPIWNHNIAASVEEKVVLCNQSSINVDISEIFPWKEQLSSRIDHVAFCKSFLQQPRLFLRIRPGNENEIRKKLERLDITYDAISPSCLAFSNSTKLDSIIDLNKQAVIQDLNSQRVGELVSPFLSNQTRRINVWDCCAGSGGKSIMLYDRSSNINLTVSDIRQTILLNLKKRFKEAGITRYNSFAGDLTSASALPISQLASFDLVIADVPCSGSGTWSRTPESLYFFNEKEIERYADVQKKIVFNILSRLKKGAIFIYVTCSVFKEENENIIDAIGKHFKIQPKEVKLFSGYGQNADSMFAASFIV